MSDLGTLEENVEHFFAEGCLSGGAHGHVLPRALQARPRRKRGSSRPQRAHRETMAPAALCLSQYPSLWQPGCLARMTLGGM